MNQILSVELPNGKSKKNKSNINSVVIFFSIILIVFAIILIGIGIYFMTHKSNENIENEEENNIVKDEPSTNDGPQINVEVESQAKLRLIITHDKQISSVSYTWNDGEAVETNNINSTNAEIEVYVPLGTNTLNVRVKDTDGLIKETGPKEYTNDEDIMLITEQIGNTAKITVESKTTIAYISYNWDGGEEKQIQINDTKTEQILEISQGEHTLNIVAVDTQTNEIKDSKTFKGDTKPTLEITTDRKNFIINAYDDEGLTKITINLNGRDLEEIEINQKNYTTTIPLEDIAERMMGNTLFKQNENGIIVSLYNVNGLVETQYKKALKQ